MGTFLILKSMPIVVMKLDENLSSQNRSNKHVFPTPVCGGETRARVHVRKKRGLTKRPEQKGSQCRTWDDTVRRRSTAALDRATGRGAHNGTLQNTREQHKHIHIRTHENKGKDRGAAGQDAGRTGTAQCGGAQHPKKRPNAVFLPLFSTTASNCASQSSQNTVDATQRRPHAHNRASNTQSVVDGRSAHRRTAPGRSAGHT